jgi:hypothetical protein
VRRILQPLSNETGKFLCSQVSESVHAHRERVVAQRKLQVVDGNSLKVPFPDDASHGLFTEAANVGFTEEFFPFLPSWAYDKGWPWTP